MPQTSNGIINGHHGDGVATGHAVAALLPPSIAELEAKAANARREHSKYGHVSFCCRELGGSLLTLEFYERSEKAAVAAQLADRELMRAMEKGDRGAP